MDLENTELKTGLENSPPRLFFFHFEYLLDNKLFQDNVSQPWHDGHFSPDNSLLWGLFCTLWGV